MTGTFCADFSSDYLSNGFKTVEIRHSKDDYILISIRILESTSNRDVFFSLFSNGVYFFFFWAIINLDQNLWLRSSIQEWPMPLKVHISTTNHTNDRNKETRSVEFSSIGKWRFFFFLLFTIVINESVEPVIGRDVLKCIVSKSERNVGRPSHQSPPNLYKMNNESQFRTFFLLSSNFFFHKTFFFSFIAAIQWVLAGKIPSSLNKIIHFCHLYIGQ